MDIRGVVSVTRKSENGARAAGAVVAGVLGGVFALLLGGFVLCFVNVAEPSVYAIKQVGGTEEMSCVPYACAASFCASVRFPALP